MTHFFGRKFVMLALAGTCKGLLLAAEPSAGAAPAEGVAEVQAWLAEVEQLRYKGAYGDGIELVHKALARAQQLADTQLATEAILQAAVMYQYLQEYDTSRAYLEIGLSHARQNRFEQLEADLLSAEGILEWTLGNLSQAERKLAAALEIRGRGEDWISMASISNNLGIIAYSAKQFAKAERHYRQGLAWMDGRANERLRGSLLSNLAESLLHMGKLEEAEPLLLEALAIEASNNDPHNLGYTYFNLGKLHARKGDARAAIALYEKALELHLSIGSSRPAALIRIRLAEEFLAGGDLEAALAALLPGYETARELNALTLLHDCTQLLAEIYRRQGRSGLSRNYAELHAWYASRAEAAEDAGPPADPVAPQGPASTAAPAAHRPVSPVQAAIIAVLGLLIAGLLLENIRLRRQDRIN